MPFDNQTFSKFSDDPRYSMLQKPVMLDRSNRANEIQFIPPATAKGSYRLISGTVDATYSCYNDSNATHFIDVYAGSDYKANLQGCYIQMSYTAVQARLTDQVAGTSFAGCPVVVDPADGLGWSICWNPAYFFNTFSLKINGSQTALEQYVSSSNFQHISTVRYLTKFKREALDDHDSLFTPCLESDFDTDAGMSIESSERAQTWLGSVGVTAAAKNVTATAANNTPKKFTKLIPLSDFLSCCDTPAVHENISKFRIEWTMRLPNQIAFRCGAALANTSDVHIFVEDMKFIFDATRMQPVQAIETAEEKKAGSVENIAFLQSDAIALSYTANSQVVATGQRDVQRVVFVLPAVGQLATSKAGVATFACRNPIQYFNGQITSINCVYGNDQPIRQPLSLSDGRLVANAASNSSIYNNAIAHMMYKKCCCADYSPLVQPAISLEKFPTYHLFCFPIYNQSTVHRTTDPKDVRIDNASNLAAVVPAVIIITKLQGAQIDSLGNVEKL